MAKINRFEDIDAWKMARILVMEIYRLTNSTHLAKDYGLSGQIQRASVSVMSNIAEGFERKTNKEFIQFLYIAKGSVGEVRSQLYTALDVNYITKETFDILYNLSQTISQRLSAFIKYLESSSK